MVTDDGADLEEIELDAEPSSSAAESDRPPVVVPFDPRKQREYIRGVVAALLLGLLCFVVVASFVSYWSGWVEREDLEGLLTIIFAPIIGLVGAATGFYFGGSSDSRSG